VAGNMMISPPHAFSDFSDEQLGALTRRTMAELEDTAGQIGIKKILGISAGLSLVQMAIASNTEHLTVALDGVNVGGENVGKWMIQVIRPRVGFDKTTTVNGSAIVLAGELHPWLKWLATKCFKKLTLMWIAGRGSVS
jgi:hypothetical protein